MKLSDITQNVLNEGITNATHGLCTAQFGVYVSPDTEMSRDIRKVEFGILSNDN